MDFSEPPLTLTAGPKRFVDVPNDLHFQKLSELHQVMKNLLFMSVPVTCTTIKNNSQNSYHSQYLQANFYVPQFFLLLAKKVMLISNESFYLKEALFSQPESICSSFGFLSELTLELFENITLVNAFSYSFTNSFYGNHFSKQFIIAVLASSLFYLVGNKRQKGVFY